MICVCIVCVFVLCVVHTVCRCERHEDVWGRLSMRGVVRKNVCGVCGVCGVWGVCVVWRYVRCDEDECVWCVWCGVRSCLCVV